MRRFIIEQGQQIIHQAQNEADKNVSRFCAFELRNLDRLHDMMYSPFMDRLMVNITSTGNFGLIWILVALILMLTEPRREIGYSMIIALMLGIAVGNIIIKNIVKRARPFFHKNYKLLIKQPWDYSFPSGHTLASFAAATTLFYMNQNVGFIALAYGILMALSRLYLRVHFFSDVFFSMVLGTGLGIAAIILYENWISFYL